jgi:hypothetical protein
VPGGERDRIHLALIGPENRNERLTPNEREWIISRFELGLEGHGAISGMTYALPAERCNSLRA